MAIALLILCAIASFAIPAKKTFFKVNLVDGTSILVTQCGDESFHFLADENGTPVVKVSEGIYRLAPEMKTTIAEAQNERAKVRNARRMAKMQKMQKQNRLRKVFGHPTSYSGKKKGIVILVNFNDKSMKSANNNSAFFAQFNKNGYDENGHVGSVHDYFYDQSYGQFDLTFDVFGPVTLSKSYKYYGKNDDIGDDLYPGEMVIEACKLANAKNNINWKNYDWDGDGEVDQVYVIYAGAGEHTSSNEYLIWPHESSLADEHSWGDGTGPLTLGGAKIDTYAVSCELRSEYSSLINGIGTACHEFCHCLGIPDMYDTSYSGNFGMGAWDLMDSGSYNGPSGYGEVPCGFTAYERWFAGWLDFTELSSSCYVKDMPSLQDEPFAYIIYNDNNRNEYFILENRQSNAWFRYVDNHTGISGMLAYHVDYDSEAWVNNEVNFLSKHPRMQIIPAAGSFGTYTSSYGMYSPTASQYESQVFPGSHDITTLDNTSHRGNSSTRPYIPIGGELFNKNTDGTFNMNKPVSDIMMTNGLISFSFMDGEEETSISTIDADARVEYFTLNGMKVERPTTSGIYLVRKGDKVLRKLIVR